MHFNDLERSLRALNTRTPPPPLHTLVAISILTQQLRLFQGGQLTAVYPVSTSANGVNCQEDSGGTPVGWHLIAEKIGQGCPLGTVFKGRIARAQATSLCDDSSDDLITSRILWLRGLESGLNLGQGVDSFDRYIYLHGTAQEHLIGQAVSHGCIRLNNRHVISLFDLVDIGTPVHIALRD